MILASMGESGFVLDALRAGARGFGSRDELTSDRLRSLVWALACGDIAFSGSLGTQLQGALMGKGGKMAGYLESETCIAALDDRERTILALLEEGLSNAEISNRLYLSEPTVKKAIGSILRKLRVNNRVQAAVMYAKYSQ
jgi:DNA-binding NarL/FixJ family response regulator